MTENLSHLDSECKYSIFIKKKKKKMYIIIPGTLSENLIVWSQGAVSPGNTYFAGLSSLLGI